MSEDIDWKDIESKAASGKDAKIKPQLVLDLLQELRSAEKDRDAAKSEVTKMQDDFNTQSAQLEKLGEELKTASKAAMPSDELTSLKNKVSTLEQENASKAQFIAQLEQDVADARNKVEEVQGKATEGEEAGGKIQELESKIGEKDQEISGLKDQLKELDDMKAELDRLKEVGGRTNPDFEKEKEDFEAEKKTLFKEMEDFEVNLRQEMEKKDEKIKELEDRLNAQEVAGPPTTGTARQRFAKAGDEDEEQGEESMTSRPVLEKVSSRKPAGGSDFAFPGTGPSAEVTTLETGDQRIVCPKCGNTKVKVEKDRSRVLSYIGGVPYYAKKYICPKCTFEFRVD
ncbi:MAG TPA: hypothetical protein VKM55_29485 [Candidatus Lokiarchaeia archaeon]|nr:hypothetical protein [Candidatus Lokiarchaeia archaeon]